MSCVAEVPKVLKCLRSDSAGNHLLFCWRGNFCKWWLRQKLCVFCRTLRDCRTIFTLHVCLQLPIIFKNIDDKILDESMTCLVYKILKAERDYYNFKVRADFFKMSSFEPIANSSRSRYYLDHKRSKKTRKQSVEFISGKFISRLNAGYLND